MSEEQLESIIMFEQELNYMINNKYRKSVVEQEFFNYQRHLRQYEILNRPLPVNNYDSTYDKVMKYIK